MLLAPRGSYLTGPASVAGMAECVTPHRAIIAEAVEVMTKTYTFVFTPEPEGGFTVTCPALPGLVTYGQTLQEARDMAQDAMDGLIEVMLEKGAARRAQQRSVLRHFDEPAQYALRVIAPYFSFSASGSS